MNRYFVTGGTGFVLTPLVRKLIADPQTELITLLTRVDRPIEEVDRIHPKVEYLQGDITEVTFPTSFYTHLIHGACDANDLLQPDAHRYYYGIVEGANRVFSWASRQRIGSILFVSSGVVKRDTVYGRGKRQSENIAEYLRLPCRIARVHSIVGEGMPLNGQYALGKFIWQAVNTGKIEYWGGTSVRSYLYVEDCADWLLAIMNARQGKPYDVGGSKPVTMAELAELVGTVASVPVTQISGSDRSDTYVPDARRTMDALGVKETVSLTEAVEKTIAHVRNTNLEAAPTPEPFSLFDSGTDRVSER